MQLKKDVMNKTPSVVARLLIGFYLALLIAVGSARFVVPDTIAVTEEEINNASVNIEGIKTDTTDVEAKLLGVLPVKNTKLEVVTEGKLVPGGKVFGVKFFTKGLMVIRLSEIETVDGKISPAKNAGIETGDVIQSINGTEVNTAEEMTRAIEDNKGSAIIVGYLRDDETFVTEMNPAMSLADKKYKTGIWVRDSTAGIGTMTYYNPSSGEFAGLGHGICDIDTGMLMPLRKGSVVDVQITDIIKGRSGNPGELKGNFDTERIGDITDNTKHGVYGSISENGFENSEAVPIGLRDEVKIGKAEILCELDENGVKAYEIEIVKIKNRDKEGKNFVINVTDERLIEKTGGIVQGMSGSPIIQNGKIIGAVTHVLVNSPTKGYGIFIENMLSES